MFTRLTLSQWDNEWVFCSHGDPELPADCHHTDNVWWRAHYCPFTPLTLTQDHAPAGKHTHTCTCTCTCTRTHRHTHTHQYTHKCPRARPGTRTHTHTHRDTNTHAHTQVHVHTQALAHMCTHRHMHTRQHTQTHTNTRANALAHTGTHAQTHIHIHVCASFECCCLIKGEVFHSPHSVTLVKTIPFLRGRDDRTTSSHNESVACLIPALWFIFTADALWHVWTLTHKHTLTQILKHTCCKSRSRGESILERWHNRSHCYLTARRSCVRVLRREGISNISLHILPVLTGRTLLGFAPGAPDSTNTPTTCRLAILHCPYPGHEQYTSCWFLGVVLWGGQPTTNC